LGAERSTPVIQCHFNWKQLSMIAGF
jgi:hypothetical protein